MTGSVTDVFSGSPPATLEPQQGMQADDASGISWRALMLAAAVGGWGLGGFGIPTGNPAATTTAPKFTDTEPGLYQSADQILDACVVPLGPTIPYAQPPSNWAPRDIDSEPAGRYQAADQILDACAVALGPSVPYAQPPSNWAPLDINSDPAGRYQADDQLIDAVAVALGPSVNYAQPPSNTGWSFTDADPLLDWAVDSDVALLPISTDIISPPAVPTTPLGLDVDVPPSAPVDIGVSGFIVPGGTPTVPPPAQPTVLDVDVAPWPSLNWTVSGFVLPAPVPIPPLLPWILGHDVEEYASAVVRGRATQEALFGFQEFSEEPGQPQLLPWGLEVEIPVPAAIRDALSDAMVIPLGPDVNPPPVVPVFPWVLDVDPGPPYRGDQADTTIQLPISTDIIPPPSVPVFPWVLDVDAGPPYVGDQADTTIALPISADIIPPPAVPVFPWVLDVEVVPTRAPVDELAVGLFTEILFPPFVPTLGRTMEPDPTEDAAWVQRRATVEAGFDAVILAPPSWAATIPPPVAGNRIHFAIVSINASDLAGAATPCPIRSVHDGTGSIPLPPGP